MSSIVTGILSSTVGLLWNKVRDSTADKFKDGDVTDAEIRKIVVRELNDIKSKIDGLSRSTLLASYNFLKEGVELLSVSLHKSNPEQKASETQDEPGEPSSVIQSGILNQAIELPRALEKLKINSDREFETARERFKDARKTATTAFCNEAFSIEDRIFAAKLRIVSEILEHVDSPETAITGCLTFLETLHSLPAIQEIFSVYLNGGIKSLLNKTQRVENVKSVMLINYVLFQYVWKFSSKYSFEVPACMPTIELPDRSFHPIRNWKKISTRKSMGEELPHPSYEQFLDEEIIPYRSAVNSQGDVLTVPDTGSSDDIMIIHEAGKIKRVETPEFAGYFLASLAVDMNNNVYVVRGRSGEVFMLTILDENYNVKANHTLDFLKDKDEFPRVRIAICKDDNIIVINDTDTLVYVCDKTGQLKYKFKRDSSWTFSLSISQQNEIMIPADDRTAVQIYTKEGNLKTTIKVPEDHEVWSVAFHYEICKILVLTWVWEKDSYFILRYLEADGELETLTFFCKNKNEYPPKLVSHPKGPVVVVRDRSITYL
ncbi:uncharacterized protein LOC114528743 [Dendronephthya gigantea]|uniref:uncharacterized protein LOC114528743 n=1 Tax=Dendronephthya gigantea TaxID=151771 RepID=UPI00106C20C0|nr:uncharacterized protein LOC114528743 [Dendronephthya gigantea]